MLCFLNVSLFFIMINIYYELQSKTNNIEMALYCNAKDKLTIIIIIKCFIHKKRQKKLSQVMNYPLPWRQNNAKKWAFINKVYVSRNKVYLTMSIERYTFMNGCVQKTELFYDCLKTTLWCITVNRIVSNANSRRSYVGFSWPNLIWFLFQSKLVV